MLAVNVERNNGACCNLIQPFLASKCPRIIQSASDIPSLLLSGQSKDNPEGLHFAKDVFQEQEKTELPGLIS